MSHLTFGAAVASRASASRDHNSTLQTHMSRSTASTWRTTDKPCHVRNVARALFQKRLVHGVARLDDVPEYSDFATFKAFADNLLSNATEITPRIGFEHTPTFRREVRKKYDADYGDDGVSERAARTSSSARTPDVERVVVVDSPCKTPTSANEPMEAAPKRLIWYRWPLSIFATAIIAAIVAILAVLVCDACANAEETGGRS